MNLKQLLIGYCLLALPTLEIKAQTIQPGKELIKLSRKFKTQESQIFHITARSFELDRLNEIFTKDSVMFHNRWLSNLGTMPSFTNFEQCSSKNKGSSLFITPLRLNTRTCFQVFPYYN